MKRPRTLPAGMDSMNDDKNNFVTVLRHFVRTDGEDTPDGYGRIGLRPSRGQGLLVGAIADYLDDPRIPDGDHGRNWLADLPEYLDECFDELRTHKKWAPLRKKYEQEAGHEIPSFVNVHEGGLHRVLVVHDIVRLMPLLAQVATKCEPEGRYPTGLSWLETKLDVYVNAQMQVIEHAWHRFVRVAYRKLMPRIKQERHRGNSGKFGKITLLSYAIAGRVMFTFNRGTAPVISYVADDSDMFGCRSGANVPYAPYQECVSMIDEVTANWDIDKFVQCDTVGFG